ncbi:hypothetical protein [Variovorax sp. GT1P44]|uniref:hypothetical protein n=1 Tax=Variovorax sp. GT1P44 TaxID=3443742 RepID=UPI003F463C7A
MSTPTVLILGCGDVGSAVAHRLFMLGANVVMQDIASPAHPRRGMAFADAMFVGTATLEGVVACLAPSTDVTRDLSVDADTIPVAALPVNVLTRNLAVDVLADAQMKKRKVSDDLRPVAPVTLGLGPGFTPGGTATSLSRPRGAQTSVKFSARGPPRR